MITIKDTLGNVRFSTEINTGSRRKFSLMSEDYIVLKFSVEDPVYFKLGDYTDTELGLFELVDLYKPTLNDSTGAYDYELRLDAHYYKWKNKIFKFNPEVGGSEAGWKLTATLDVHLGVFLRNLSALGYTYKGTPFEVNIDSTVAKTSRLIVYDNTNLIDALTQMAETWECEWWVEDNQIRFGRCEFGDPVDFVINENVERMPREESKATFATRVYAFGSTRNIPNDYRPVDESVVVNGIVQKRLMMPTGVPHVDAYPDMTTEEAVEDVVIFDYIYPRRTGTMSSVTPVERTENVENEDGSTTQQKYTVYQFKDTGITFSKDYILPGEELRIVFQTGAMAGMDFAVTFNPDNLPEKLEDGSWNPQAQLWEIVRNEDYGRMLPADTLIPTNGDTYNLYGFDSTSPVFEDMIKRAEEELEEKARDYVEKTKIDPNTYPCTMMSDYMYNDGNVRTNEFTVGARINLINPAYFENGRVSRVIGFEFDLDIPYFSPTFTIGETASYSRIGEIEDKVDELTYKGQVFTGTGSGVYVIGTNDNTPPTNKNVYSALKVLREFVRYQGWVNQPLRTFDPVKFNSVTSPLFIFNELTTPEFVSGLLGAGTRLKDNHLELDEITVRKRMNVFELFIQRVRAVGGQLLLSPASIKISTVEELENGYKCSFNTDDQTIPEPFVLNDQAFHQTFTGKGINRYWRLTTEAGDDYFVLSKTDCEPGSGIPQPGDEVILLGNRTDKARQSAMMLSAYGNDAPYLDTYDGINDYNLSGKLLTREGNLTGIVDEVFGQLSGSGFYGKNVYLRGKFALSSGVSVEDKFGQTDSQMNNLQGQLTNQQGQLNTQQGQITNIQTDILAIPGQIKQEVSQTVTYEVGNLQIGMVNLLKGSNVELGAQENILGRYNFDRKPETGKIYTLVVCYTLGENNTEIYPYQDSGATAIISLKTKGEKIIESRTFTYRSTVGSSYMVFTQLPKGTYGSKVHWAVLVEGNKGPNSWIPSQADNDAKAQAIAKAEAELAETKANAYADGIVTEAEQNAINEAQARLDALKIGSVNLVSRKMMLDWNNKEDGIAVWGQDSDGIYLNVSPNALYYNVSGGSALNDIFIGEGKYKTDTQYVLSIDWKTATTELTDKVGLVIGVYYTDGTNVIVFYTSNQQTTKKRTDYITEKGKTIKKIYGGYGNPINCLIYSLALYEGNKVLAEPPVATEDLTGQSNVNLVDGGKEVTVTSSASDQWGNRNLVIPKLKPNTVYYLSFKAKNLTGSPTAYSAILSNKEIKTTYHRLDSVSGGIMITPNNFTEGEAKLLLYAGKGGSTAGNSVKYTDVMLVEGFTPPSSYSPSPGDIDQAIQDAIAKTVDITAPSQVFKYGPGYTGTPTPSSIVLTATPRNFTPTSYQWQFLNGSTWINITIDGASSTYSVNPNSTTLFPSGTNVRTFRCICNGDEKLSDSFTLAKLADGATGQPGADGRGVKSTAVTYQSSTSGTTVPTGTWSASIPAVAAGSYLWTKMVITYTSGDPSTMYSVARMGTNGTNGNNGNGVSSTVITYQASTSGTTAPTGTWGSTIPSVPAGQYLWTRTVINYTNGSSSTIYSVGMTGKTGADGKDAYTILLGNESHAFAGSTAAALAGSTTCSVVAYKGATRVAATIGTISGLPTGMTASVASNGTTTPVITFTVTTSMTTASGTVNIPVTVDGKTFTKVFSYSIAFRGDPGESINGKMLYKDPEFKKGLNGVVKYTNSSNVSPDYIASKLTVERVTKPSDAPTQSGYCLKVTCKAVQSPWYGGVYQSITSRANAVFVQKIIAKLPVGYNINTHSNPMGTGYKDTWLTSNTGTGKYETYVRKVVCGTTGNFSTGGIVYITGNPAPTESAPLEWYIAYMTAFDLTADGYGDIVEIAKTETVAGINNNPDSVTVYAKKTDFNSLNQVVNQQGSQLQVNTNSIDAIVTKNGSGTIVSIKPEMVEITGATVIQDGNGNKVNIFGIGDKVISVNGGVFSVDKAGKVIMQNAEIAGKITAKTGEIGSFTIDGIWLKGSELRISGSQITFENGNNQVYLNSHPDMATGGAVKLGTFVLTGGSYNGLESARAVALIAAAPSDNYSCAIAVTSGRVLMKGQIHFDNVVAYTGSGAVTITANSGHFIYLTPITGNPVVSVSSGLPIGSWFIIAHATTAGGFYYIKLSGSDRFRRRGNAYQQVNSNNQDPSLIFKVSDTTWIIGNLPVNWIDWN